MNDEELDEALAPLRELLDSRKTVEFSKQINFKNFQSEVKGMASIDFDNIKEKVSGVVGSIVGKSTEAAKTVSGKAQVLAKKAKLNTEIASERDSLKKKYQELGKLYYEKYAGNTDPDFAESAAAIEESLAKIAAKQEELTALDAEEPEVEVVVDEIEETVEEEAVEAAREAEEVAEEVLEHFEETINIIPEQEHI